MPDEHLLILPEDAVLNKLDGLLFVGEGSHLAYMASIVPEGGTVVEIGSYKGKSACFLASGLRYAGNTTAKLHCIDLWTAGVTTPPAQRTKAVTDAFTRQVANMGLTDYIIQHMVDSVEFGKEWNIPIDLLFIDGDHTYEHVHADWTNFSKHVKKGGHVCLHDHLARYPGVCQVERQDILPTEWKKFENKESIWTVERI